MNVWVGIAPSAGITWEWICWGGQNENEFVDYSKPFRNAFIQFSKQRYRTVEAVNQAWGKKFVSFADIVIPSREERLKRDLEDLRVPARMQYQIDFAECFAKVTADAVCHFVSTIKTCSQRRLLTGAYYGYVNALMDGRLSQHSGHLALKQVLDSPDLDILSAPTRYSDRGPGEGGGFMIPEGSARLHGKLCIAESDIRTLHASQPIGRCATLSQSRAVLEREIGALLAVNGTMRWYDFSLGWVFGDPRLAQVAETLNRVEKEVIQSRPVLSDHTDSIAVLTSAEAPRYTAISSQINRMFVGDQYPQLTRAGVKFDSYLQEDLESIPQQHKVWLFLNPLRMTPQQIEHIRKNLIKPGNTLIFCYGVNVTGDNGIDLNPMEKLLGMKFETDLRYGKRASTLTADGENLLNGPQTKTQRCSAPYGPVFYPIEGARILAAADDGKPTLALREQNNCRLIFSGVPALPAEWLARLARQSGLNVYNSAPGDITWASGNLLVIHSSVGGQREFTVPLQTGVAKELISSGKFPVRKGKFNYDMAPMSTAIFLCR